MHLPLQVRHKRLGFDPWFWKIPWGGYATHSSILAWRSPWIEEPGGVLSIGSQSVRHDWGNWAWAQMYLAQMILKDLWSLDRLWGLWPSHQTVSPWSRLCSLPLEMFSFRWLCCDSWGRKESDTTERLIWSDLTTQSHSCLLSSLQLVSLV